MQSNNVRSVILYSHTHFLKVQRRVCKSVKERRCGDGRREGSCKAFCEGVNEDIYIHNYTHMIIYALKNIYFYKLFIKIHKHISVCYIDYKK